MNIRKKFLMSSVLVNAFNNRSGWKLDANGVIEMRDGNPVIVREDGVESLVQATTIAALNAEAKSHRERAEKAEKALKSFEGLDVEKARTALETLSKIDQKKLIDAGEIDKVREEISKGYISQITEKETMLTESQRKLDSLLLNSAFDGSPFVKERIAIPAAILRSHYSQAFKVENDKIVPYHPNGSKVYSLKKAGELAEFDEALEILVSQSPFKDAVLRAPNHSGSGSNGEGGARSGDKTIKRADFEKLGAADKHKAATTLTIVD
jgi:hypothetical protein